MAESPIVWPRKTPKAVAPLARGSFTMSDRYCEVCKATKSRKLFPTRSLRREDGSLVMVCRPCIAHELLLRHSG